MTQDIDLRELAVDRAVPESAQIPRQRHVLTRYVLPLSLIAGFLCLTGWAAWDSVFPPTPVRVIPVISTTTEVRQAGTPLFQAAGWIEPRPTPIRAAALAAGVVERLLVVEDQAVEKGAPVAELVRDDARLAFDSARADLKLRQAELSEAKAALTAAMTRLEQPVHLQAELNAAQASLATIQTQLTNLPFELRRAESDLEALRRDYEGKRAADGVVAGVEIDIAKSKAESAAALVDELHDRSESLTKIHNALTQRRDALKTQLELLADEVKARDETQARLQAAEARVTQAKVAVAEAQLRLDRMTVTAPVDGRVYQLIAPPGTRIGSGMTQMQGHDGSTVVTMYQPERLQVRVDTRFEDIPKVRLGQPVELRNPALPTAISGRVLFISSEADIQKNTLEVKVEIPDPVAVLKPEMLMDVTFLAPSTPKDTATSSQEIRLCVPRQLIHQDDDGSFVWLADQSAGVARRTRVQTASDASGPVVEVTQGLTVSSRLIAGNADQLQDGQRITVTGEDSVPAAGTSGRSMQNGSTDPDHSSAESTP